MYETGRRWGYVDANSNAQREAGETVVESIADLDANGDMVTVTSFKTNSTTIESVTTFNWPLAGYTVTRVVNSPEEKIRFRSVMLTID